MRGSGSQEDLCSPSPPLEEELSGELLEEEEVGEELGEDEGLELPPFAGVPTAEDPIKAAPSSIASFPATTSP